MNAELHFANLPSLRLWSQRCFIYNDSPSDYEVLDALLLPNRIILAMGGPGREITSR